MPFAKGELESSVMATVPQGLKPDDKGRLFGTAEAVP